MPTYLNAYFNWGNYERPGRPNEAKQQTSSQTNPTNLVVYQTWLVLDLSPKKSQRCLAVHNPAAAWHHVQDTLEPFGKDQHPLNCFMANADEGHTVPPASKRIL